MVAVQEYVTMHPTLALIAAVFCMGAGGALLVGGATTMVAIAWFTK